MRSPRFTVSVLAAVSAFAAEPGMVFVPAGDYLRGRSHADPDPETKWFPHVLKDDKPVRRIYVDPFYLDEHEVTNASYAAFVQAKRHRAPVHWPQGRIPPGKEKHPVVNVSWDDAAAYARWAGKRLPTEAEWERACRGMAEGARFLTGAEITSGDARFDRVDGPGEVCRFKANYFGLYDMAGNVWEWCADWYGRDYYQQAPERNPPGPSDGQYRVLRGGSWADVAKSLSCAHRSWARPGERSPNVGFRCARSLRPRARVVAGASRVE